MRSELYPLWAKLDKRLLEHQQLCMQDGTTIPSFPWSAECPEILSLWDQLTHPDNLDALLEWQSPNMNNFAHAATVEAIATCRRRIAASL